MADLADCAILKIIEKPAGISTGPSCVGNTLLPRVWKVLNTIPKRETDKTCVQLNIIA